MTSGGFVRSVRGGWWRAVLVGLGGAAALGAVACQPPRPTTGPGSAEGYLTDVIQRFDSGEQTPGGSTRVSWFVPAVLKNVTSAPVVLFLHGFGAGEPALYQATIDHIARQGNLVVFPYFNAGDPFQDLDQNVMVDRIVANAQTAFTALGGTADLSRLYVYGHSAGAAFGSVWEHNSGIPAQGYVLGNPSVNPTDIIPVPVEIIPVDYEAEAPSTTGPVVLLTGNDDDIAPPQDAIDLYGFLTGASSRVVWQAITDTTMSPPITADHLAPLNLFSSADTLDWRFYWSALDQMMAGDGTPTFDMGSWSNGTPVADPVQLAG